MNKLSYPFIVVTTSDTQLPLPVVPEGTPGYVAAFTSLEKASAYMMGQGKTNWQIKLVTRPTFEALRASLSSLGVKGLAFDPTGPHTGQVFEFEALSHFPNALGLR